MYQGKKILAIIPARWGSKGIPLKNIIDLDGKPLIVYSLDSAQKSQYLDRVIVSTNSLEIKQVAESYGADVPFMRPEALAEDTSKTIDAVVHAVNWLKEHQNERYDFVMVIQNTVPLRKNWHIDEAIETLLNSEERSLVSVSEVEDHPFLMRTIASDGLLENLLPMNSTIRRQDMPKYYKVNGAIYLQKLDEFFDADVSLNDGVLPYIMEQRYSVDIDTYLDLQLVLYYLQKEKEELMAKMK